MNLETLPFTLLLIATGVLVIQAQTPLELECGTKRKCVKDHLCLTSEEERGGAMHINIRFGDESCPESYVCCYIENIKKEEEEEDFPSGCGHRNIHRVGFFQDSFIEHESEFGEFPWVVAILHQTKLRDVVFRRYICGGSLITPRVVLAGAHCVFKAQIEDLLVRAGEWEPNEIYELYPHQDRKVAEIIIHEGFRERVLYNDLALLFVRIPFVLTANVNTICLPPHGAEFKKERCYATGWGKSNFTHTKYANVLKKVDLPMVSRKICQDILRSTILTIVFDLHESFVCAGGELGKDTCTTDGGSPLMCPISGAVERYYLVGLVAYGIGCGDDQIPGVYVNVPHLRNWIDQQLAAKDVDTSYFEYY